MTATARVEGNPIQEVDRLLKLPIAQLRRDHKSNETRGSFRITHDIKEGFLSFSNQEDPADSLVQVSYFFLEPHDVYNVRVHSNEGDSVLVRGALHQIDPGEIYPSFSFGWHLEGGGLFTASVDPADGIGFQYSEDREGWRRRTRFGHENGQRGLENILAGMRSTLPKYDWQREFTSEEVEDYKRIKASLPTNLRGQERLLDKPIIWRIDYPTKAAELIEASRIREFAGQFS